MHPAKGTSIVNGSLWGSSSEDWAQFQEPTCAPVYRAVFDRVNLSRGQAHADLGCGAGLAAELAAERGALVTGLDASEALLKIAKQRVPQGDFRLGELESLPFAEDTFDLVTGFNSFQYAGDPGSALREAKRVTRPGGLVVVMTWGPPVGMEAASLLAALRPLLPAPPPGAPGPFALSDEDALRTFATSAGLAVESVFDVDSPWHYADLEAGVRGLGSSGVAARAIAHKGKEEVDAAHRKALQPFQQSDGSYRIGAMFRCLLALA